MPFTKGHRTNIGRKHSLKTRILMREKALGENNPMWNGGRTIKCGYVCLHKPEHPFCNSNGYIKEHRLIMEEHLGRTLNREEHIHHRNNNKLDNRLSNLQLVTNSEHIKLHRKELNKKLRIAFKKLRKRINKKCVVCEKYFDTRPCEGHVFCSRECYYKKMIGQRWHQSYKNGGKDD